MAKSKVIDIVDGHNWLNRAYFAGKRNAPLTLKDGTPIGVVKTVASMINQLIERRMRSNGEVHLVVIFDHDKGSDRRKKTMRAFLEKYIRGENASKLPERYLSGYKGNRFTEEPDEKSISLRAQIPILIKYLQARGIMVVRSPLGEADDVIGSICIQLGCRKMVHSRDGDFAQLLKPDTRLRLPKQDNCEEETLTFNSCLPKFGVIPTMFVDYLALAGDVSDNIPGIPGIGDKTAIELMQNYEDLETVFSTEHKGARGKKLADPFFQKLAFMCRDLVQIKTDLPVEKKVAAYRLPEFSKVKSTVRAVEKSLKFKPTLKS